MESQISGLEGRLNQRCIKGLIFSKKIANELKPHGAEIIKLFQQDFILEDIARLYVYPNYRVNKGIAVSAVSYLLQNIMQRDAYKRLASKHLEQGRIKGGVSTYRKKMGIFGRSTKEFMDDSSKGGIKALSERKGIHSLSPEEVSSNTIKSLIARGFNPFNNEVKSTEFGHIAEKYYIIALRFTGQYDYYRGWQYVTMKVNALYNKNRTPKQVRDFYYDWIKRFSLKMDKESFEAF